MDPRPKVRQQEDRVSLAMEAEQRQERASVWKASVDRAKTAGQTSPVNPDEMEAGPVHPDWSQSPIEVSSRTSPMENKRFESVAEAEQLVQWADNDRLKDFEHRIYGLGGFKPNGKGF